MSEREIRSLLRRICAKLDDKTAKARRVARKAVLPTMLGTGMALSGGCDEGRAVQTDGIIAPADMAYADMAGMNLDVWPPDAGSPDGPVPMPDLMYMSPDVGPTDAAKVDAGPQPLYTAADAGPIPPYTAPDAS